MTTDKPTIAIDFDGVIHSYSRGWQEGRIYDLPVPWFFEWALEAQKHFKLVIHSSRTATDYGIDQIRMWMKAQMVNYPPIDIEVSGKKPPAFITIDDRCFCFQGDWKDPALQPEELLKFEPWMTRMIGSEE